MPPFMLEIQKAVPTYVRPVLDYVWMYKDDFIKWPQKQLLLMPGTTRENYHKYDQAVLEQMKSAGIKPNTLSNGPAIAVFALAGGERPIRANSKKQWTIHHIYDGQFPHSASAASTHAVRNGNYFTDSAGLVAIHPVADALADEVPYFAWLLRYEAFLRFGFDPDNVFVN